MQSGLGIRKALFLQVRRARQVKNRVFLLNYHLVKIMLDTKRKITPQQVKDIWSELTALWAKTTGEPNISIAVLDGPVDRSHPCFEKAQLSTVNTLSLEGRGQGLALQHGTHVASIIFGHHGSSVKGVAPSCRGLIVPVFGEDKKDMLAPCSQLNLAQAITQAVEHGANIINISGGELVSSGEPHPILGKAITLCADRGVLVVAAGGNDGCQCLHVPAATSSAAILAVGAMDDQGRPLPSSNWGQKYQVQGILAPGENIAGAVPGGHVASRSGTSFAAPIISGVAALLLSVQLAQGVKPSVSDVRAALLESCHACNPQEISDCRRFMVGSLNIMGAYQRITSQTQLKVSSAFTPQVVETNNQSTRKNGGKMSEQEQTLDIQSQEQEVEPTEVKPEETTASVSASSAESNESPVMVINDSEVPAVVESTPSTPLVSPAVTASRVTPASCGNGQPPALGYALGAVGYDFGSEARQDSFQQAGLGNPNDPTQLLAYLEERPYEASDIIWTLYLDAVPIYAIQPMGPYANVVYERLREFLSDQLNNGVERVSIPGFVGGSVTLLSGQSVPLIVPTLRGMYSWSTPALVKAIVGDGEESAEIQAGVANFLQRVYYELRNLGLSSEERAINFAATNAFQVAMVFEAAIRENLQLDNIGVEASPICRPGADCWDVKLTFFDPQKRLERARQVYRFTVDVSDVIPVTVGAVRSFSVY